MSLNLCKIDAYCTNLVMQTLCTHVDHKLSPSMDESDDTCIDPVDLLHLLQSDDDLNRETNDAGLSKREMNDSSNYAMDSPFDYDTLFDDDSSCEKTCSNQECSVTNTNNANNANNAAASSVLRNSINNDNHPSFVQTSNRNNVYNWHSGGYTNAFIGQSNPSPSPSPSPSVVNRATGANRSIDPNISFEQNFAKTKENLFKSMQKSEISRAHIEQVIDKRIIRRHSSNSMELACSRKRLQEMFVDEPNIMRNRSEGSHVKDQYLSQRPESGGGIRNFVMRRPSMGNQLHTSNAFLSSSERNSTLKHDHPHVNTNSKYNRRSSWHTDRGFVSSESIMTPFFQGAASYDLKETLNYDMDGDEI